jgi:N-acetylmuramoyl-L-alanine amidase
MRIKNHKLVGIPYKRSPNQSGIIKPKYLVIHYTAGRSAERSVATLTNRKRKASAHLVIGRDGSVTQLVPFNKKAWHAGKSEWKGLTGLNAHSIGIELDNPGFLHKDESGGWRTWFGTSVDAKNVIIARHKNGGKLKGWHIYSEAQMDKLEEISELLFEKYGLEDVIGHDDIRPKGKSDPGPAFNMKSFRAQLIGRDTEDDEDDDDSDEIDVPEFVYYNPAGK